MLAEMKPWAAVVRVSHMGERKASSDTFHADRDQLDAIQSWAKAKGVTIEVMEPELGVSGGLALERRASLLRAVEGVERNEYAGIVVAYLSRLGRNVAEQLRVWDRVQAAGGEVVTVREEIDTSTASGRLHRNLLLSVDAHEREQHAERFEERRRAATEAGIWQRRQTPRGYRRDKATRRLVADRQADQVRETFQAFLTGTTISELARRLRMTQSGVRQLLRNRIYRGELRVGRHDNPAAHEPLIDSDTFEAVQAKLANGVRPARNGRAPALLAGLSRCSSCGHVMTRGNSDGRATYQCPARHSGERCPEPASIMAERLDAHVEPIVLAELARLQVTVTEGDQVEKARAKVAAAERELEVYLSAVSAADVGADAFAAGARERRERLEAATEEMRSELGRRPAMPEVGTGAEVWDDLNGHDRNALLRALLAAVVVRAAGGRVVPVAERVRVLAHGVEVNLPRNGGHEPGGIVPIPFPDTDGEGVLGVPTDQNGSQGAGGAI
jgi:DNA invertase Pin-like site-specific DNA recombinase